MMAFEQADCLLQGTKKTVKTKEQIEIKILLLLQHQRRNQMRDGTDERMLLTV